jgi:hypothetical protein
MGSGQTGIVNMLHLSTERLAALADDTPTAVETEHLAVCAECAAERVAYQRLVAGAEEERRRIAPPLTSWDALAAELRAERLLGTPEERAAANRRRSMLRIAGRAAAGLLLVVGGAIGGRVSVGASPLPRFPFGMGSTAVAEIDDGTRGDTLAFSSMDHALAALSASQREYQRAVNYLAAHDTTVHGDDAFQVYRTRLAALDDMAERSRQALYQAPQDPVINQYYLSTLGAREATLRQMGAAMPSGTRLTRF